MPSVRYVQARRLSPRRRRNIPAPGKRLRFRRRLRRPGLPCFLDCGRTLVMARTRVAYESATSLHGWPSRGATLTDAHGFVAPFQGFSACDWPPSQGDAPRLRRDALPWAAMYLAFQAEGDAATLCPCTLPLHYVVAVMQARTVTELRSQIGIDPGGFSCRHFATVDAPCRPYLGLKPKAITCRRFATKTDGRQPHMALRTHANSAFTLTPLPAVASRLWMHRAGCSLG